MENNFKRENRYLVLKTKDLDLLTTAEQEILGVLTSTVANLRIQTGKQDLKCLVIESDWPEYEPTWKAIEARVTKDGK